MYLLRTLHLILIIGNHINGYLFLKNFILDSLDFSLNQYFLDVELKVK